jgi:hypothetical protein
LASQKEIEELYIDHYFSDFKDKSLFHQKYRLAELNIKKQIYEILNSALLGNYISDFNVEVKGLITSKEKNYSKVIQSNNNRINEL